GLARRFLEFFARKAGRSGLALDSGAEAALVEYDWPGNVRELRNTIERAVILWPASVLGREALPETIVEHADGAVRLGGPHTVEAVEWEHIRRVLARTDSVDEASRILGIDSSTLWRKRKKYAE